MSSHTYDIRDIPVLTEAIDPAELPPMALDPPARLHDASGIDAISAVQVAPPADAAALQAAIVEDALKMAASITGEAARDIEALLYERIVEQLRAQLPELVARIVREHLPGEPEEPGDPHG